MAFKPFADDTTAVNIHGDDLTITNDPARIVIAGSLDITRDKAGLTAALALQQAVTDIVEALQSDAALSEQVKEEPAAPTGSVKNPFV